MLEKIQELKTAVINTLQFGLTEPVLYLTMLLIIILLIGLTFGWLAKKCKMPLLLGYILAGILFAMIPGDHLKAGDVENFINCLANLGIGLLLFSMGLEFEKKDIAPIRKLAIGGTFFQVFLSMCVGSLVTYGMAKYAEVHCPELFGSDKNWVTYCIFGTAFVSTSTAVVLKTLVNTKQIAKLSAKVMIAMSIVQDLTVIPLFLFVSIAAVTSGACGAGNWTQKYTPLVLMAIFFVMFFFLAKLNKKSDLLKQLNVLLDSQELLLLALIFFALFFGCVASCFQVSFSFGAFLAGILLSNSPLRQKAVNLMAPVRDVFVLLFFVSIGTAFDMAFFLKYWKIILVIAIATSLSRTIPLAAISWLNGFRNIIPFAMLFGMFPTSEIAFVVATMAVDYGFISDNLRYVIICATIVSMLAGPLIDRLTSPTYRLWRRIATHRKATGKTFPMPPIDGNIIVIGTGENVRFIMRKLHLLNEPCMLWDVEKDLSTLEKRKLNDATDGIRAFYGSAETLLSADRLNDLTTKPKMIISEQRETNGLQDINDKYVDTIKVPLVILLGINESLNENVKIDDEHKNRVVIQNYDMFIENLENFIAKK